MKKIIELPFFSGFYESNLENSDTEYYVTKQEIEYWKERTGIELTEDDFEFNYEERR